ncbi:Aldo/keto reductase [Wolfiporia cocos MD-104 SS10]|uniref:Aldo/keto reductase n=1 Tax=Wolfiporia cocos (strain MD-104) TaxID=742152 RepID=A0A2H3JNW1_WOLCO|nr:Aldo/keto reductase [Wolfiporia cocos MD-104 SS10]
MCVRLDAPQPVYTLPDLAIPDDAEDKPVVGVPVSACGALQLPEVLFGAAALSQIYNDDAHISGFTPVRTVRLALRYGVNAFDTSPYYQESEIVLGTVLKALAVDFPRSSYKLMTKCGRYGSRVADCDYSPATIRASVQRSLSRLHTDYLDAVYLHDVEFVATQVGPRVAGDPTLALTERKAEYGLVEGEEAKVWGAGDQQILDALAELRKMKDEGIVKSIGITGYPLPMLLRLALLALHTPPYQPLDVLLSYSHLTLQTNAFEAFAPHFRERARIPQLLTASPLNMGLLTPTPPAWHPAPPELKAAAKTAVEQCTDWEGGLPNLAVGYGYRKAKKLGVPMVVGLSNHREVHENVQVWREITEGKADQNRVAQEENISRMFGEHHGWSWASPPSYLL